MPGEDERLEILRIGPSLGGAESLGDADHGPQPDQATIGAPEIHIFQVTGLAHAAAIRCQLYVVSLAIPGQAVVLGDVGTAREHADGVGDLLGGDAERPGTISIDAEAQLGAGQVEVQADLVDSGKTLEVVRALYPKAHFATVYAKPKGKPMVDSFITEVSQDTWIFFPWDMALQYVEPYRGTA